MRILATADLHGNLPLVPPCDLLLIAGDVCPMWDHHTEIQAYWLDYDFRNWLKNIPARKIVGIAGNHDFIFEKEPARVDELGLPWTYLRDSETDFEGLRIYGLPWVPNLLNWAFYGSRERLAELYGRIPKGTDIVLSHGPPYQYGDFSLMGHVHTGSRTVNDMLHRVKPKAFVCGHIHEGFGHYRFAPQHGDEIDIYNVALVDENYVVRGRVNVKGHLEPTLVQIMDDAEQDETDSERPVQDPHSDSRHSSECTSGSDPALYDVVAAEDPELVALNA